MVLLQRKLYFSKDLEGVQRFPGVGSNFFQGVQMSAYAYLGQTAFFSPRIENNKYAQIDTNISVSSVYIKFQQSKTTKLPYFNSLQLRNAFFLNIIFSRKYFRNTISVKLAKAFS